MSALLDLLVMTIVTCSILSHRAYYFLAFCNILIKKQSSHAWSNKVNSYSASHDN